MTTTHIDIAVKLLTDAAGFFRNLAEQNQDIKDQMIENAGIFDKMAEVLVADPKGVMEEEPNHALAGRLLGDAANFFRALADNNEPIKDQMLQNADVYEQVSVLITNDPMGSME